MIWLVKVSLNRLDCLVALVESQKVRDLLLYRFECLLLFWDCYLFNLMFILFLLLERTNEIFKCCIEFFF